MTLLLKSWAVSHIETLEGDLADEQVGGLLVVTDIAESDGSGAVAVGLLDASGGKVRLRSSLSGELLAVSLASGGFSCGLLGTSHFDGGCLFLLLHC